MKEGIKVSFINQHETRVDDLVIKVEIVGLTHGNGTKDDIVDGLKEDNLQNVGTSDNMTWQHLLNETNTKRHG